MYDFISEYQVDEYLHKTVNGTNQKLRLEEFSNARLYAYNFREEGLWIWSWFKRRVGILGQTGAGDNYVFDTA